MRITDDTELTEDEINDLLSDEERDSGWDGDDAFDCATASFPAPK